MAKKFLFKHDAREKLKAGVDAVANPVKVTLGPNGKNVFYNTHYGGKSQTTKDGYTITKHIYVEDEVESVGAEAMKEVALKTVESAGDGTTTATVLAQAMITEGLKMVTVGAKPIEIKRGMDKAVSKVVEKISQLSQKVGDDNEKIKSIATISANNDSEIGGLISEAFSKIGSDGKLLIEDSQTAETKIKVVDGVEILRGMMSEFFITDISKMNCVYEDPLILIADYSISLMKDLMPILDKAMPTGRPIIFMASDIEGEALATIIANKVRGGARWCAVKAPSAYKKELLSDIAVLTGGTVIAEEYGLKLENAEMKHLGTCEKIVITFGNPGTTTIIKGAGDKKVIEDRKEEIKGKIKNETNKQVREIDENRLARISGSVGVIYVGAATEVEMKEKKDRVDDAVRATKAAIEEGIVAGGGTCLINCINSLKEVECETEDEKVGVKVIEKALEAPLNQILINADKTDGSIISAIKNGSEKGYNAKTMRFENLIETGVVDPAKVVRVALENANSVAGMIITSECLMAEVKTK